ncbi:MAG: stealth family protein [Angustibacter sp.]
MTRVVRAMRRLGAHAPPPLLVRLSALRHGETALQRRLLGRSAPGTAPDPRQPLSGVAQLDANLFAALDALAAAEVPCAVLEAGTMRRRVVVVTGDHEDAARRALAATTASVQAVGSAVLRLHHGDPAFGCDVEVWPLVSSGARPDGGAFEPGTAVAPRANRWVRYLEPGERVPATAQVGGRDVPTYAGLLKPHLLDVGFPIDVVYTWVDGSDPDWQRRKEQTRLELDAEHHHPSAVTGSRFTSHDELRYSLRSLETYADWVRTIYVVTDGQRPAWLRTDHPRLRVVDHRELFAGTEALPTFNSHAIEARLHHVPGLSEHFLYLNDDVFFGRPVRPELFFEASGLTRFFLTDALIDLAGPSARDLPVASAAKRTRAAVERLHGRTVSQRFQHVAHPQRRSTLEQIEAQLPDELAATVHSRFRSPADLSVPSSLAHYVGYASGRAVPGTLSYLYCDVSERRAPIKLQRLARRRDADVFCLNEVDTPGVHPGHRLMVDFLESYFPRPSSFETDPLRRPR